MRYFEMLNIIHENDLEVSFRKSHLGGIRVDVRKKVAGKLITDSREITKDEIGASRVYTHNNYLPEMIAAVLNTEKELNLQPKQSP